LGGSNILQRIVSLGGFLFLVRYLSLADYGRLNLLLSLVWPAVALITLGLQGVIQSEVTVARGRENWGRVRDILSEYGYLNLILFFVVLIISLFLQKSVLVAGWVGIEYSPYFYSLAGYLFFHLVLSYSVLILKSYEYLKSVAAVETGEIVIRTILFVGLWALVPINLANIFIAYSAAKMLAAFASLYLARPVFLRVMSHQRVTRGVLREMIKSFAKWSMVKSILSQFTGSIDLWLVRYFISSEAVAIYSVANKGLSFVVKLLPFSVIIEPMIQKSIDNKEFVSIVIKKARKYSFVYFSVAVVGIYLFMRPFLSIFAPQYVTGIVVFYILAPKLWATSLEMGQTPLLIAHRAQFFLFLQFLAVFILRIVLMTGGLYFLGINGLAGAHVLVVVSTFLLREVYIRKRLDYHLLTPKDYYTTDYYDRLIIEKVKAVIMRIVPLGLRS
jgi:O-antigen/teichoic acid export membrane protein